MRRFIVCKLMINPSGKLGGLKPPDLHNEHLSRDVKSTYAPTGPQDSWKHLHEVISHCLKPLELVHDRMEQVFRPRQLGSRHHSNAALDDLQSLKYQLKAQEIAINKDEHDANWATKDLYPDGLHNMTKDDPFRMFNLKRRLVYASGQDGVYLAPGEDKWDPGFGTRRCRKKSKKGPGDKSEDEESEQDDSGDEIVGLLEHLVHGVVERTSDAEPTQDLTHSEAIKLEGKDEDFEDVDFDVLLAGKLSPRGPFEVLLRSSKFADQRLPS